jgi:PAS domain S-box-containing protein
MAPGSRTEGGSADDLTIGANRRASVGWWEGYFTLSPRHLPWYAAVIGAFFLAIAVLIPEVRISLVVQLVLVEASVLGVWLLLRSGRFRAASAVAVVAAWVVVAGAALVTGGVSEVHYVTFGVVLVMAGLLLGKGGAVMVAVLTLAFGRYAPAVAQLAPPAPPIIRVAFAYFFIIVFLALAQHEMRDAVKEAATSLSMLRGTLESTGDGILVVDGAGAVVGYNQKFLEMWGIPPALMATGEDARLIESVLGKVREPDRFLAKIRQLYDDPVAVSLDTVEFLDGRVVERYSQPRRLGETVEGRVWSFRDVTERHRAEEDRRRLEEELFQAQKMESLGRLAGGIAHDFNNILTAIISNAELAREDAADRPEVAEGLNEVLKAANRARELVRQIQFFSRTRPGEREPVSLPKVVGETLKLLHASLPRLIEVRFEPGTEDFPVLANPSQVHQVVMNLCINAGQALPEGRGRVEVSLAATRLLPSEPVPAAGLAPGRYMVLAVADSGAGMTPAVQARIFEPFFSTRQPGEGSGLGLSVVHSIVRNHGGGIAVSSALGQGSTFRVFLPAADPEGGAGVSSG